MSENAMPKILLRLLRANPIGQAISAFILVLVAMASVALAKDAKIGNVTINLVPPPNFCELTELNPSDARMLKLVRDMVSSAQNDLLGMYADCQQLSDWHTGARKLLDDFVQFQTLSSMKSADAPRITGETVKEACAQMRTQGEKIATDMMPDINKRAAELSKQIRMNEVRFLGVIDEEPLACYAALLQKFSTEVGTEKVQIGLTATTTLKDKAVYFILFAPYVDEQTVSGMLVTHKRNVATLLAANGSRQ
jgi:hypothetical protein